MSKKPILITGGTGFLGSALTFKFLQAQQAVVIFGRNQEKIARTFGSQVQAVTAFSDLPDAGSFAGVINLAGAGIFDQRWSTTRKQTLRNSRIDFTQHLVDWIANSEAKPSVLISGSAIGVYGNHGDTLITERTIAKPDFAQQLCTDWENTASQAENLGLRVCLIRTGLVMGKGGGIVQRMLLPFRMGLGGRLGSGQQWMSWIHLQDWLAIVQSMLDNPQMQGAYNATAPTPVTNAEFSAALADIMKRPMLLPMPEMVLKVLLGEMSSLILGSQRVMPQRLLKDGFKFSYSQLDAALQDLLN